MSSQWGYALCFEFSRWAFRTVSSTFLKLKWAQIPLHFLWKGLNALWKGFCHIKIQLTTFSNILPFLKYHKDLFSNKTYRHNAVASFFCKHSYAWILWRKKVSLKRIFFSLPFYLGNNSVTVCLFCPSKGTCSRTIFKTSELLGTLYWHFPFDCG